MVVFAPFASAVQSPWKNGHGVTRTLYSEPSETQADTFDWRLSVATVVPPAPFSSYPGVDRQFVAGPHGSVTLCVDGVTHLVDACSVVRFAGEAAVTAASATAQSAFGQPSINLNVMTRRQSCSADVTVERLDGPFRWPRSSISALVVLSGTATIDEVELGEFDALVNCAERSIHFGNATAALVKIVTRPDLDKDVIVA